MQRSRRNAPAGDEENKECAHFDRRDGSPRHARPGVLPCALADRAVFWAELGLVAGPQLLSRLGRALQDASEGDPELQQAMCLAADHVESKCLVWHAQFSKAKACTELRDTDVCNSSNSTLSDDGLSETSEGSLQPRGVFRLLPESLWVKLLPGLGGFSNALTWTIFLVICSGRFVYHAFYMKDPDWLVSKLRVTTGCMVIIAVKSLLHIPQVFALVKISRGDALDEALHTELKLRSGETLRYFLKVFAVSLSVIQLATLVVQSYIIPGFGLEYNAVMVVFHVLFFVPAMMFVLVWKISLMRIDRLCDRIRSGSAAMAGAWAQATREYLAVVRLIDGMWRSSGFALAYALLLTFNMVSVAVTLAMAQTDDTAEDLMFEAFIVIRLSVATCAFFYLWARIHARCTSSSHHQQSLLYLARQHLGEVCPQDRMDHFAFLESVVGLKCGAEIPGVGVVSHKFVASLMRVATVGVSVIIGLTLKVMTIRAAA